MKKCTLLGLRSLIGGILVLSLNVVNAQNYPQSDIIKDLKIEDTREISFGRGDNFPVTWSNDGRLYTMYCDGYGFNGSEDISNGFAELFGNPSSIDAQNISSPDIEFIGGGKKGRKTSGLVSIKGVLYALVRNLNTDGTGMTLYWSENKGSSWQEVDWNWPEIGLADWCNMGKDYSLNNDGYAYFIGHNGKSAYTAYDSFIMARVPVDQLLVKSAYRYFAGYKSNGLPKWTQDINSRKPVFEAKGRCYRPGIVYNPGIARYMLFTMPHRINTVYEHYLGVFESENPWGPWKRVTEEIGFEEFRYHPRVPSKWISRSGLTFWYNFSVLPSAANKKRYKYNLEKASIILKPDRTSMLYSATKYANESHSDDESIISIKNDFTGNYFVNDIDDGSWIRFANVNYVSNTNYIEVEVSSKNSGGIISVKRKGPKGPLLAQVEVPDTGGLLRFQKIRVPISHSGGNEKICFVFSANSDIEQSMFRFKSFEIGKE